MLRFAFEHVVYLKAINIIFDWSLAVPYFVKSIRFNCFVIDSICISNVEEI